MDSELEQHIEQQQNADHEKSNEASHDHEKTIASNNDHEKTIQMAEVGDDEEKQTINNKDIVGGAESDSDSDVILKDDLNDLAKQIHDLVQEKNIKKFKKEYDPSNKPWKCKCNLSKIINYGVPLFIFLLLIIATSSRTERDTVTSESTICQEIIFTISNNSTTETQEIYSECYDHSNDGLSSYNPISFGWKIVLSMIPFICVFQGVLAYNLSSRYVAPFTLLITIILGLTFFEDEGWWIEPSGKQSNIVTVSGLVFMTIIDRTIWTVFEYAFNVFTSFFFLRVLELWGIIELMRIEFESICQNDNRKVTLILFCFAIMIAVVAPGGSNFLIAGAIMVDINHRKNKKGLIRDDYDKRIGSICLFGNGLTSAFNLVGVCIIAISSDILDLARESGDKQCATGEHPIEWEEKCAAKQIGGYFSLMFFIFSIITPFIMAAMYNRKTSFKEIIIDLRKDFRVLLLCGTIYAVVQFLCAWLIGPELVCLLSAGLALVGYYAYIQCERHGIKMNGTPNLKQRRFGIPFIILVGLLCAIRLIPGFEEILEGGDSETWQLIFNPYVLDVRYLTYKFTRSFGWLAHPGMTVLFVSILTVFIVPHTNISDNTINETCINNNYKNKSPTKYKRALEKDKTALIVVEELYANDIGSQRKYVLIEAFKKSIFEALPVMLSIGCYASIAKIMAAFNMTQSIANGIVYALAGAPQIYVAFMPIIGMLGSGLTGSTTTSNFLFGRLQVTTAIELNIININNQINTVWEVAAVQILGATGGEIISPMNAVFSTLLLSSRFPESDLIKMVLKLFLVWMICCIIVSYIFMNTNIYLPVV